MKNKYFIVRTISIITAAIGLIMLIYGVMLSATGSEGTSSAEREQMPEEYIEKYFSDESQSIEDFIEPEYSEENQG